MIQINLHFLLKQLPVKVQENGLFKKMFNKMINTEVGLMWVRKILENISVNGRCRGHC